MLSQGIHVLWRGVAFVLSEAVLRPLVRVFLHQAVTGDFRDDRCGGNAALDAVAPNNRTMRIVEPECVATIDQQIRWFNERLQLSDGEVHGFFGGNEDAMRIDVRGIGHADSPVAVRNNPFICFLALFLVQLLAVANDDACSRRRPTEGFALEHRQRQYARACDDGACKGASPCFIDAGDDGGRIDIVTLSGLGTEKEVLGEAMG
jgi:hypothetical protein